MLTRLTREQLAARPEYVRFMQTLAVGEGGMATTADEGVGKQSVKNRLSAAARAAGVKIKYHHSDENTVIFAVVGRTTDPLTTAPYTGKQRGRPPRPS